MSKLHHSAAAYYHKETRYSKSHIQEHLQRRQKPRNVKAFKDIPDEATKVVLPQPAQTPTGLTELNLENISFLIHHTCGVTKALKTIGGEFLFRAYPSAGALFPLEFYLATHGTPEINAGIYNYDPRSHAVYMIGDQDSVKALGGLLPEDQPNCMALIITSVFNRTTIKYGARGYRYMLMDAGHAAANAVIASSGMGIGCSVITDFPDQMITDALKLNDHEETGMLICLFGSEAGSFPGKLEPSVDRENPDELEPLELFIHKTTSCHIVGAEKLALPSPGKILIPEGFDVFEAIRNRRSKRKYSNEPLPAADFETCRMLSDELVKCMPDAPIKTYLLSNHMENIEPGLYSMEGSELSLVREGELSKKVAEACLWQNMAGEAAAAIIFALDWNGLPSTGNRGLRKAYAYVGFVGEGPYLAVMGEKLGACGVGAFFDDELTETLELPDGQEAVYMVVFGNLK